MWEREKPNDCMVLKRENVKKGGKDEREDIS